MGGAAGGFAELHGWPDRMPAGAGAYTDYAAPKFIVSAILAALEYRRRTGTGQYIDLSQVEAAVHFLGPAFLDYTVNGRVQSRQGNASSDYAPHGVYPVAGDDRWIAIAATTEQQWLDLLQVAGHREWHDDARFSSNAGRLANREALDTLLAQWTHDRDGAVLEATLQRAAVPAHRVNTSADCFADSQLHARGHFVTVEHAEFGPVPLESSRMRFSATPAGLPRPGPSLGQDNEHVLRMILGMSDEEVVELIASGALE
jgi:benzylsuccinate CoA-transferase BbsF subunit